VFLSIIIPTYDRQPILEKCLKALEHQHTATPYEIVVVDDGSTDGTVDWLQKTAFPHVRLFQQNHQGPAAARNLGVAEAKATPLFLSTVIW
jgi:glycosyltransferase involved in cell wall biosynthesis